MASPQLNKLHEIISFAVYPRYSSAIMLNYNLLLLVLLLILRLFSNVSITLLNDLKKKKKQRDVLQRLVDFRNRS